MPKDKYLFNESKPELKDFYEDMCSHLPANILQEFVARMATQYSIFELQALCEKHTEMGKVIKAYAMRPLIQKDFGKRALTIYDNLIQQEEHKDLSLSKFYQICKKLKEEVEQLREFINSKEMKFATVLIDWPTHAAAKLDDLSNFFDKTIEKHYQALIAYLARPGLQDICGTTPLIWASCKGHFATVKALLAQPGIDVNKADNNGKTPLIEAAFGGHLETVKMLLAQLGIDVNEADNSGNTPLIWAIRHGHFEIVNLLLVQQGIDVNKASNNGDTPLFWAARHRDLDTIKMLLARTGIEVNKADNDGRTPLNWAASNGHLGTVNVLLAKAGIDVNKADNDGNTPLNWATRNGHLETANVLLAKSGIDVNKADNAGNTPLNWAAYKGHFTGHLKIVKVLLDHPGIDVNKADNGGKTPLYWAELYGYEEIALLIKNHIASTSNNVTGSLATLCYAALLNQGAANNGAVSRSQQNNCCII